MTKFASMACLGALLAGATFTTGCATECHDEKDPVTGETKRVCHAENLVRYEGESQSATLDYPASHDIAIDGVNGNVDVRIGSAASVQAIFHPFSYRGNDQADEDVAIEDMANDLTCSITDDGSRIIVDCSRSSGANDGLGADMVVEIPSGYTGGIAIDPGNGYVSGDLGGTQAYTTIINDQAGDITVSNAAGKLDISGDFNVDVSVSGWSAENGRVISTGQLGDLVLSVPSDAMGSIHATCEEAPVVGPSSPPADWMETGTDLDKTFTFGTGGAVEVSASESVTIQIR